MQVKNNFEKPTLEIVQNYSIDPKLKGRYNERSLINAIKKIQETRILPSELETKNNVLRYAVDEWFSQRMRSKYQELSPEIFSIKREIIAKPNRVINNEGKTESFNGEFRVKIPVLCSAEMGIEDGWKEKLSKDSGYSYNRYNITLFSRIPYVPPEVRNAGKEAVAFAYKTYAEALETEEIGDVVISNPEYAPDPSKSKLLVLWKPKPSEIHVEAQKIERDPALVLNYEKPYLVKTWSVPGEEPFMSVVNACKVDLNRFFEKNKS